MNNEFTDNNNLEDMDAVWVAKRLAAIDAMRVPHGDLESLRSDVRRRARMPRLAAAAAAVLVVAGAAAFASSGRGAGPVQQIRAGAGTASRSSTTQVPDHGSHEPDSVTNALDNWKNNVPQPVGRTEPEGFILPREADAMDQAVTDYVFARGYDRSDALGPELTNALRVVNAIPVRDKNGDEVGRWSGRFITGAEYAGERARAQAVIDEFESTN